MLRLTYIVYDAAAIIYEPYSAPPGAQPTGFRPAGYAGGKKKIRRKKG